MKRKIYYLFSLFLIALNGYALADVIEPGRNSIDHFRGPAGYIHNCPNVFEILSLVLFFSFCFHFVYLLIKFRKELFTKLSKEERKTTEKRIFGVLAKYLIAYVIILIVEVIIEKIL